MGAITIRNLPEAVHDGLRRMAADGNVSVEALVRNVLGAAVQPGGAAGGKVMGMAEAPMPWGAADVARPAVDLWGALRGMVHPHAGQVQDLADPTDERWKAEG